MAIEASGKAGPSSLVSEETVIAAFAPVEAPPTVNAFPVQAPGNPVEQAPTFRPIWAPGAYARLMHSQNKNVVRELAAEGHERVSRNAVSPITAENRVPTSDLTAITGIRPADYSNDIAELKLQQTGHPVQSKGPSSDGSVSGLPTRASRRAPDEARTSSRRLLSRFKKH